MSTLFKQIRRKYNSISRASFATIPDYGTNDGSVSRLKLGDTLVMQKSFSQTEVENFSKISTDKNPIYLDDSYAAKSPYKKRIVHGALCNGLLSAVLGSLGGKNTIWLSEEIDFREPLFADELLECTGTIVKIKKNHVWAKVTASTPATSPSKVVVQGYGRVLAGDSFVEGRPLKPGDVPPPL